MAMARPKLMFKQVARSNIEGCGGGRGSGASLLMEEQLFEMQQPWRDSP